MESVTLTLLKTRVKLDSKIYSQVQPNTAWYVKFRNSFAFANVYSLIDICVFYLESTWFIKTEVKWQLPLKLYDALFGGFKMCIPVIFPILRPT